MNWEYADEPWNGRRAATTIFSLACGVEDQHCFCPSVGVTPDSTKGADGLLVPVEGGWLVEATHRQGRAPSSRPTPRTSPNRPAGAGDEGSAFRSGALERVGQNVADRRRARPRLARQPLRGPLLGQLGIRCNGCGACTMVCPTCHCFDIVDEDEGVGCGTRRRCWDTCQAGKFTLHASGHNPRADQIARYRQRITHKFAIYPIKFGEVLCTGCGRCVRTCQMGQNIGEILVAIDEYAQQTRRRAGDRERRRGRRLMANLYQPHLATVTEVVDETVDTRTFRLEFKDEDFRQGFSFKAGQFGEYSVFGAGESTFCIASPPTRDGYIECSFKAAGKVTAELREVNVGDTMGFRGPYGNWFPLDEMEGQGPRLHRRGHRPGAGALRHLERPRPARRVRQG